MIEKYLRRTGWFQSKPTTLVPLGFIAIIGFFLITQHPVHFLSILPFALILLCPLMHVFMMRSMHSHHEEHTGNGDQHLDRQSFNQPNEGGKE
jgi:Protein of unknown function (DUF2933)